MDNIVIFVKNLASGGAEKQAVLLAKTLDGHYGSHIVVWQGGRIDDRYRAMLAGTGVEVHGIYGGTIARMRGLVALLRRLRPAAVFSYLTAANAIAALAGRAAGVRVVTSLRSTVLPRAKLVADRFVTNHLAAATVSNSHAGVDIFAARGFDRRRLRAIPNCFDGISPYSLRPERADGTVRVITVGRFVPDKDYRTAIAAFAAAARRHDGLRLDIVGYGQLEQQIRRWIDEHGIADRTTVHINPPGIPALLREADIYLSTSLFEGTSNAIMEGLNADLPVVATDTGDNRRLVVDGVGGYVLPVGDTDGIARALAALAADRPARLAMGAASKRHLAEGFSTDTFLESYTQLINDLK